MKSRFAEEQMVAILREAHRVDLRCTMRKLSVLLVDDNSQFLKAARDIWTIRKVLKVSVVHTNSRLIVDLPFHHEKSNILCPLFVTN